MNKFTAIAIVALLGAANAHAQSTSSAQQTSTSQSVAQGTIQFSQTPANQHITETVRNVSAPISGSYAPSMSALDCRTTSQFGIAIAGVSVIGGGGNEGKTCVIETGASESARQAYNETNSDRKEKLMKAAVAIRCQASPEIYNAYIAAGLDCLGMKPKELISRTDTQPESTRVAGN